MLALGAVQAGTQIYSGYKQKQAADQNADLMRQQAAFQRDSTYEQSANVNKQGETFKGSQLAGVAQSGVKIDKGSPLALLRETDKRIQKDVSRIRQSGDRALESGNNQANQLEQQGQDAFNASLISGATSFAGTLAGNINMPGSTANNVTPNGSPSMSSPYKNQGGTSFTSKTPNTNAWMANGVNEAAGFGGYSGNPTGYDNLNVGWEPGRETVTTKKDIGLGNYNWKKNLPKAWN